MTRDELIARLERQVADAEAFKSTAPVADVLRATLDEVAQLEDAGLHVVTASEGAEMISVKEASRRCGMSPEWIYKRREALPWVIKIETGAVRCSVRKLEAWLKRRAA